MVLTTNSDDPGEDTGGPVELVSDAEIQQAFKAIQSNRVVGSDHLPPEV